MADLRTIYRTEIRKKMRELFGYPNDLAVPEIKKVTVNAGVGAMKDSPELEKNVIADLTKIIGQKPRVRKTKKSISGFKLRAGQVVGAAVTLRGKRMYDFIEKLVKVVLPRLRDFHGLSEKGLDGRGNFSIGISEQTIFPEIRPDEAKENFGLQVSITTSAKDNEQGKKLLELLGLPFQKINNQETR